MFDTESYCTLCPCLKLILADIVLVDEKFQGTIKKKKKKKKKEKKEIEKRRKWKRNLSLNWNFAAKIQISYFINLLSINQFKTKKIKKKKKKKEKKEIKKKKKKKQK